MANREIVQIQEQSTLQMQGGKIKYQFHPLNLHQDRSVGICVFVP